MFGSVLLEVRVVPVQVGLQQLTHVMVRAGGNDRRRRLLLELTSPRIQAVRGLHRLLLIVDAAPHVVCLTSVLRTDHVNRARRCAGGTRLRRRCPTHGRSCLRVGLKLRQIFTDANK